MREVLADLGPRNRRSRTSKEPLGSFFLGQSHLLARSDAPPATVSLNPPRRGNLLDDRLSADGGMVRGGGKDLSTWPARTRTLNLLIQSQTCYQLHHGPSAAGRLAPAFRQFIKPGRACKRSLSWMFWPVSARVHQSAWNSAFSWTGHLQAAGRRTPRA